MHVFNVFDKSKDNNHNTTILTCLEITPVFFEETLTFENNKNFLNTLRLSYIFGNIFYIKIKTTVS